MASIQRSLLIEAPISVSFSFWSDFERYPAFMEDVARVSVDHADRMTWQRRENGETVAVEVRVVERLEQRQLAWRASRGPERAAVITFAPLEGDATWFTFTLDYEADEAEGDVAGRLTAVSRRIDRELRHARELIEQTYVEAGRKQPRPQCT
ncbi:MAG: SRPBCC family protein [Tepidiformaceae bacterium]